MSRAEPKSSEAKQPNGLWLLGTLSELERPRAVSAVSHKPSPYIVMAGVARVSSTSKLERFGLSGPSVGFSLYEFLCEFLCNIISTTIYYKLSTVLQDTHYKTANSSPVLNLAHQRLYQCVYLRLNPSRPRSSRLYAHTCAARHLHKQD